MQNIRSAGGFSFDDSNKTRSDRSLETNPGILRVFRTSSHFPVTLSINSDCLNMEDGGYQESYNTRVMN